MPEKQFTALTKTRCYDKQCAMAWNCDILPEKCNENLASWIREKAKEKKVFERFLISKKISKNDMKQKLKEKFNVGDKVKKPSFTKCVKMSKEVENLKNGILNGESLINHIQHQQQKQSKLGNSNADRDAKSIVGGRLQFYKGKCLISAPRSRLASNYCVGIRGPPLSLSRKKKTPSQTEKKLSGAVWYILVFVHPLDHFQEENLHSFVCCVWCRVFFFEFSLSLPLVSFPLFSLLSYIFIYSNNFHFAPDVGVFFMMNDVWSFAESSTKSLIPKFPFHLVPLQPNMEFLFLAAMANSFYRPFSRCLRATHL